MTQTLRQLVDKLRPILEASEKEFSTITLVKAKGHPYAETLISVHGSYDLMMLISCLLRNANLTLRQEEGTDALIRYFTAIADSIDDLLGGRGDAKEVEPERARPQ